MKQLFSNAATSALASKRNVVVCALVTGSVLFPSAAFADEVRREYARSADSCALWDVGLGSSAHHWVLMDPGPIGAGNPDGTWDNSSRLLSAPFTSPWLGLASQQPGNLSASLVDGTSKSVTIWSDPGNGFEPANAVIFYGFVPSKQDDHSDGSVSDLTYLGGDGTLGLGSGAGEAYRCPGGHFCGVDFGWTNEASKYRSAMCQRDYELGAPPGKNVPYGVSLRASLDKFNSALVGGIQGVVAQQSSKFNGATVTVASTNVVPVSVAYAKNMYDNSPAHSEVGVTSGQTIWYDDWFGGMLRFHIALKISKSGLSDAYTYADIYEDLRINRHDNGTPKQSFSPFQDGNHDLPAVPFVPEPGVRFSLLSTPSMSGWGEFGCAFEDIFTFGLADACKSDSDIYDTVWGALVDNNRNDQMIATKFWEAVGQGSSIQSLANGNAGLQQLLSTLDKNGDGYLGGCDFRIGVTCGTTKDSSGKTVPAPWDLAAAGLWWLECPVGSAGPECLFAANGGSYTPRISLQANFSDIADNSDFADSTATFGGSTIHSLPVAANYNATPTYVHFTPDDSSKFELVYNSINW